MKPAQVSGFARVTSLILLNVVVMGAAAAPAGPQDPTTAPLVVRAQAMVDSMVKLDFAAVESQYTAAMKTALPVGRLSGVWAGVVLYAGVFKERRSARAERRGPMTVVVVTCAFERHDVDVNLAFNPDGELGGVSMRPTAATPLYVPPSYAKPDTIVETDVTVGTGEWALPGTLTLPRGAGPFPVVILVHGSGPSDRDASFGPNKPFKDLALGLASRGVGVLRYDKRTSVHAAKLAKIPTFTVKDESIDDALAGAALLRQAPGVDPNRVFVLGHSLGGMVVPRIAALDSRLAGLISMAGAVRSLEQSIVDQTRYMALADGTISVEEQRAITDAGDLFRTVRALTEADLGSSRGVFGAPAAYWLDLRGYDPPAAAVAMTQPLLVLQGERDYQVTMDDFKKWQAALTGKTSVTFRSYPALNHLFLAGTGMSLPAEYNVTGHVAEEVVRDIAEWVASLKPSRTADRRNPQGLAR